MSLARRVEAWVDAAGYAIDELPVALEAVLAAGFEPRNVRVVRDDSISGDSSNERRDGITKAAGVAGVGILTADAAELTRRLETTEAEILFVVRSGVPRIDVLAKSVGFMDRFHADIVYGDSTTREGLPMLRPAFSPVRLLANDYLGPVVGARVAALRKLGGFRPEARRAHVLDTVLRAHRAGARIELVPDDLAVEGLLLDDFAETSSAQRVVVEHFVERFARRTEVHEVEPFVRRLRFMFDDAPLVSVVIPTRGTSARIAGEERVLVVEAIRGIVERSTYPNLEFIVVADAETPSSVVDALEELCGPRLRVVIWDAPFNFSAKMNRGAAAAKGEYLLLLNDDVEVVNDDWLEPLVGLAEIDGVGIVGAHLYFEDSTVQHAGQVYTGGVAGHAAFGWPGGRDDNIKSMVTDHEVSGVTAACALIRRDLYLALGGFTLALPGNYNDVDLNMKVRASGLSAVVTPWARLYHFESKTRDPKILPSDLSTLQARWSSRMQEEMYSRML